MRPILVHDKQTLLAHFRRNPPLHVYSIGDLDDFYWRYTTWYAAQEGDELSACALLYTRSSLPVLLAIAQEPVPMVRLLEGALPFLPRRMYAHLTPGVEEGLREDYRLTSHGLHLKMALERREKIASIDTSSTRAIAAADLPGLLELYERSYPGHWFEPEMLESGQYFGLWEHGALVAAAGVHVYSPRYQVAALGNIVTHPEHRGRGLAKRVTARVCKSLLEQCETIGLNVKADNSPAIACYSALGFVTAGQYHEAMLEATSTP